MLCVLVTRQISIWGKLKTSKCGEGRCVYRFGYTQKWMSNIDLSPGLTNRLQKCHKWPTWYFSLNLVMCRFVWWLRSCVGLGDNIKYMKIYYYLLVIYFYCVKYIIGNQSIQTSEKNLLAVSMKSKLCIQDNMEWRMTLLYTLVSRCYGMGLSIC